MLKQFTYPGRNLNATATNTAPKGVGVMVPSRKKSLNVAETPQTSAEDVSPCLSLDQVDQTKIVIHRNDRPADPPLTSFLVVKKIAGGIRKCAGCSTEIKNTVVGYNQDEDFQYCLAWHKAYITCTISGIHTCKLTKSYKLASAALGVIISILSIPNHTKVDQEDFSRPFTPQGERQIFLNQQIKSLYLCIIYHLKATDQLI